MGVSSKKDDKRDVLRVEKRFVFCAKCSQKFPKIIKISIQRHPNASFNKES